MCIEFYLHCTWISGDLKRTKTSTRARAHWKSAALLWQTYNYAVCTAINPSSFSFSVMLLFFFFSNASSFSFVFWHLTFWQFRLASKFYTAICVRVLSLLQYHSILYIRKQALTQNYHTHTHKKTHTHTRETIAWKDEMWKYSGQISTIPYIQLLINHFA